MNDARTMSVEIDIRDAEQDVAEAWSILSDSRTRTKAKLAIPLLQRAIGKLRKLDEDEAAGVKERTVAV